MKPWEQKPTWYAGIGSRQTPSLIANKMRAIATRLRLMGWKLRSGGARGADMEFEAGAGDGRFAAYEVVGDTIVKRGRDYSGPDNDPIDRKVVDIAERIACFHHPAWHSLGAHARLLHARNVVQVLGETLEARQMLFPQHSAFVLCWTPDGAIAGEETTDRTGGTGQAIRIATYSKIPVYNLQREDHFALWSELLQGAP